jgi:hypothetical protein
MVARITVLGTGKMGSALARRLAKAGFELTLWDRTADRAKELGLGGLTRRGRRSGGVRHHQPHRSRSPQGHLSRAARRARGGAWSALPRDEYRRARFRGRARAPRYIHGVSSHRCTDRGRNRDRRAGRGVDPGGRRRRRLRAGPADPRALRDGPACRAAGERGAPQAEIATMPDAERQEIRDIYAAKGFSRKLLEDVVDTITANRETWMATMMDEELHLQPVQTADILRTALVITIATLVGQLDSADSVHGSATNVGVGPGDRVERPGPLWSRRLFRGHARGRLAEDRAENGGHRPRGRSDRLLSSVACSTQPERESDGLGR